MKSIRRCTNMPRTKGSKNRPKSDFASQIAEKQSVIQTLTAEGRGNPEGYRRKESQSGSESCRRSEKGRS